MPVATQNKITRSCGLSVVVGLSITYPSPASWEGYDRRLTRRRREGDVLLSALERQNDAEQNALVWTRLPWSADRKSTRLNSSHLGISYAVFCLKKKTTD